MNFKNKLPSWIKKFYAEPMGRANTSKLLTLRAANIPPGLTLPKHDAHKKGAYFWQIHMLANICLKAVIALIFFFFSSATLPYGCNCTV